MGIDGFDERDIAAVAETDPTDLAVWVAELVADAGTRRRARTTWLTQQAGEEGTFAGVLLDLAERHAVVVLQLANGTRRRGSIAAVGTDALVLHEGTARHTILRTDAVVAVHTLAGTTPSVGDRGASRSAVGFVEAVRAVAAPGTRVQTKGAQPDSAVSGEVRQVGRDVVALATDGGGIAYLALASLVELSVAESG